MAALIESSLRAYRLLEKKTEEKKTQITCVGAREELSFKEPMCCRH
jgi:hypothetical protein